MSQDTIAKLCAWAACLGAVTVCVREPDKRFHDWVAQAIPPGNCAFHKPEYHYPVSVGELSILHAHMQRGGSVILLSPQAADDAMTLAHELGHVAADLAGCDDRDRKPNQTLLRHAEKYGLEFDPETNAELMAECVGRRMLELPLSAELRRFSNDAFSEFTRRTGWQATNAKTWTPKQLRF
jgi:hypothetical protein